MHLINIELLTEQQLPWFITVMESIGNDTISVYNSLKADCPLIYMYSPFLFAFLT